MSGIVLFKIKNDLSYNFYRDLSDAIVQIALECHNGVLFTPAFYDKSLVEKIGGVQTFCLSDDFLYYNPNWLDNCDILDFDNNEGKKLFHNNYRGIVKIAKYIESKGISFEIIIDNQRNYCFPNDYKIVFCSANEIEQILLEESKANIKNAFQCPPLWLKIRSL